MTEPLRHQLTMEQQAEDRQYALEVRQALLMLVDAIERRHKMPRTSDLRRELKEARRSREMSH